MMKLRALRVPEFNDGPGSERRQTWPRADWLPLSAIAAAIFRPSGLLLPIRQVFSTSILVYILSVGTGVIMARMLGPTGRGELSAMMLWPGLAAGLFTFGIRPALTYSLAARRGEPPCLILMGLLLTFCAGLVAAGCGALIVPIWLQGYSPEVITFAQWAMLIAPVNLLLRSAKGILQARGQYGFYNRNHYVPPLISLAALGGLASAGFLNPYTAAIAILSPPLPLLIA